MSDQELIERLIININDFSDEIRREIESIGPTDFPLRWHKTRKMYADDHEKMHLDVELTRICSDIIGPRQLFICANGGSGIDAARLRGVIEDRVYSGHDPRTIATETIDLFRRGRSDVFWVFGIGGIEVDAPIEIEDGISLLPPAQVPASYMREKHFGISADDKYIFKEYPKNATAAIVFAFKDEKVIYAEGEQFPDGRFESIHEFKDNIIDACVVSGSDSATYVVHYNHFGHPGCGYSGLSSGYGHPITLPTHFHPEPLDRDAFVEMLRLMKQLNPEMRGIMKRVIERYRRSSWSRMADANALDLGLAVEMMLMHDKNSDNTEIGNKISTRGAWLIGETFEKRVEISDTIRGLYKARSDAAHRGLVRNVNIPHIDGARPIVMEIIRRLIRNAEFPDWNAIVLGGPQKAAHTPGSTP